MHVDLPASRRVILFGGSRNPKTSKKTSFGSRKAAIPLRRSDPIRCDDDDERRTPSSEMPTSSQSSRPCRPCLSYSRRRSPDIHKRQTDSVLVSVICPTPYGALQAFLLLEAQCGQSFLQTVSFHSLRCVAYAGPVLGL